MSSRLCVRKSGGRPPSRLQVGLFERTGSHLRASGTALEK